MNNELNLMRARLRQHGGESQQDRMIKDKRETLDRVVLYSYQGARVQKIDSNEVVPALINPNKIKQDYDDKVISVGYEYGYTPGTIFDWVNTNTKWLIYLQDLTELAYFKGDIRKCNYEIKWKDAQGEILSTYAAIRGPVETKINFIQKGGISLDTPNHSLNILMPKNKDTLNYFKRYSEFYIQSLGEASSEICWRVEGVDSISMPGVLEIIAVEYYANEFEDDIEKGIVEGLVVEEIPAPQDEEIAGEVFIKPKLSYTYQYSGAEEGEWKYDSRLPIEAQINGKEITLIWKAVYTGQFILSYGNAEKTIVIESLF